MTIQNWEHAWAPYDEDTYEQVLAAILPTDIVLDIGAGDLRLARRMAEKTQQVIAIEQNVALLDEKATLPANVSVVVGDARQVAFPKQATVAVLLMRHCRHFELYFDKLRSSGCARLLTNARWGLDVEQVDLRTARVPFTAVSLGWYACQCGAAGFVPGAADRLTLAQLAVMTEVSHCPTCKPALADRIHAN